MKLSKYLELIGIANDQEQTTKNDKILQEELLKSGLTWVYHQYCKIPQCADWEKLEKQAEENKIGLWKNENSIPPWEWRRM